MLQRGRKFAGRCENCRFDKQQTQLLRAGSEVTMERKYMKPLRWPTDAEQHAYMRERQAQNKAKTKNNKNERWAAGRLKESVKKWTEQAQWGYRLFDFWCAELGVAVEIDGPEHNQKYDAHRDEYNYRRSGIVVLRVRNRNEEDMRRCLLAIASECSWKDRKEKMGIASKSK